MRRSFFFLHICQLFLDTEFSYLFLSFGLFFRLNTMRWFVHAINLSNYTDFLQLLFIFAVSI